MYNFANARLYQGTTQNKANIIMDVLVKKNRNTLTKYFVVINITSVADLGNF
jgi:hypothetical protein